VKERIKETREYVEERRREPERYPESPRPPSNYRPQEPQNSPRPSNNRPQDNNYRPNSKPVFRPQEPQNSPRPPSNYRPQELQGGPRPPSNYRPTDSVSPPPARKQLTSNESFILDNVFAVVHSDGTVEIRTKDGQNQQPPPTKAPQSRTRGPTNPPPTNSLPEGWQEVTAKDGRVYYWNLDTDEVSWEKPSSRRPMARQAQDRPGW